MRPDFRFLVNPPAPQLGRCSAILNGYTNGRGPDYRVSQHRTTLTLVDMASKKLKSPAAACSSRAD